MRSMLGNAETRIVNVKANANIYDIAELCRLTGMPVYLEKNGEGDLVIIESFSVRREMPKLREELLRIEADRFHGAPDHLAREIASVVERTYCMEVVKDPYEGGYVVSFPDLPGCITCGETLEEALINANDAKHAWIEATLEMASEESACRKLQAVEHEADMTE